MSYSIVSNIYIEKNCELMNVTYRYTDSNTLAPSPSMEFKVHSYEVPLERIEAEMDDLISDIKLSRELFREVLVEDLIFCAYRGYGQLFSDDDCEYFENQISVAKHEGKNLNNYLY